MLILLATRRASAPDVTPAEAPAPPRTLPDNLLRLPEPARSRAWALLCSLHDALREAPVDARTSFLLQQTRDQYLPDTVSAYLHLTPAARSRASARCRESTKLASMTTFSPSARKSSARRKISW